VTDDTPESIEQFALETRQHLDEVEAILLQVEWEAPNKAAIAALFRGFHSIKGLARLLDLHGLETLAHHAESLLGEVRADRLILKPAIQNILIEALDAVRSLRERAIAGDGDALPRPALLAALDAAAKNARDTPDGASVIIDVPDPAEAPLYDDLEMLSYFAEMLVEFLPNLAGLVGGDGDPMRAAEGIDTLMIGTERLQLKGMHSRLEALLADEETLAIDRLAAVIADARRFGRLVGQDAGADALLAIVAQPLRRAQMDAAQHLLTKLPHGADLARADAERLVSLSAAGVADAGVAPLVLQALAQPAALGAVLAAVTLLANDASADYAVAAANLQAVLEAGQRLPPAPQKILEDRGVDPHQLEGIGSVALARLATMLEGGERQLMVVNVAPPSGSGMPAFIAWLGRRLPPVAARAVTLAGSPVVAMLVVTTESEAALEADIRAAADIGSLDLRRLDGRRFEHPWALELMGGSLRAGDAADRQVRVPIEILDKLFGRLGEFFGVSGALNALVVDSQAPIMLQRLADYVAARAPDQMPAIEILQRQQKDLSDVEAEIQRLISQIHEATLGLRVIPLDTMFNRFPRMIRDLAKAQGKSIRFEARADGIKLDKGMMELLSDPLMHMLRNAVSHGIEPTEERAARDKPRLAIIRLSATQNGNRIAIRITDDGCGIDTERVRQRAVLQGLVTEAESHRLSQNQVNRFIFTPGFSTAEQVTGISGRGVGMDVALVNVSRLGGRIDISSTPGLGTTFHLDLPLSAAMLTVLLAETAVQTLAFPERMVVESVTVGRDAVQYINGQRSILLHDRFLPIFSAAMLLRLPEPPTARRNEDLSIIVAAVGRSRYGIEVDHLLRRHELLMRETHPRIAQLPGIGGVATLGTDRIVLVVDPEGLTELSRQAAVPGLRSPVRAAE
jgi:two-component system chemotaxis sensor kinase CheA